MRPGPPANRTMQTMLTSGSCTSGMTPTASYTANNQLTSALYHYDQAGDVDVDPQNQYLYDAEGRICAVSSPNPLGGTIMTGYIYDADGTRVSKGTIQAWSCNPTTSGYTTTSDYILGPGGEQFSEYTMTNGTMTWLHTNVWADGMLIATYAQDDTVKSGTTTENGLLHFYFDDPLGTRRAQTDYAGHLEQNCSSLPYGDSETCGSSPTEHLFTGKERDAESGNDYFGARYYASSMGRFMSPDWSAKEDPVPYAKLDDPQSLNLYAYVRNNPLGGVDSNGHEGTAAEATAQAAEDWIFGSTPVQFDGGKKRRPAAQQQPSKQDQVKSAALGAKNLAACTTQFFGSGFNFTLANLPNIDATQNLGGMTIGRTKASMVPDDGVATILIDKGSFSSMKPADLAITYLHETANARAIQQFTQWSGPDFVNGGISRQDRALLGPMGRMPSNGQSHASSGDHDIGNQFERCLNGSPLE